MNKNVFIIIPAFNEERTIENVINDIRDKGNVIVVDDCSIDNTKKIAKKTGVIVLSHRINRGQGATLQTGMDYAIKHNAEVVVHFDADGQHSSGEICKMIQPILNNEVDVVLGSRFLNNNSNTPLSRKIILKLGIWFTKFISDIKVTDTHNGFRALSSKALRKIKINQDRMAHASEILDEIIKNNLTYKEVPVTITYTDYSTNKGQNSINFIKILRDLLWGKLFK